MLSLGNVMRAQKVAGRCGTRKFDHALLETERSCVIVDSYSAALDS